MKRKHDLLKEKDHTRDTVAQITGWCLAVALLHRLADEIDKRRGRR